MEQVDAKELVLEILRDLREAQDITFRPMTYMDWNAYSGAEPDTVIMSTGQWDYLLAPNGELFACSYEREVAVTLTPDAMRL